MADQWMRFGSAVQFLQALGPQTERMREEVEKEESVLSLTLPHFGHFVLILIYSPNLLFSSSLIRRIHYFYSSISRYFLNLLLGMSDTQCQQRTKTDLVIFAWVIDTSGFLWTFLSLSLLCVFFPSLIICMSLSRLSLASSLSVSLPVTPPWWWAGEGYWVNWACSVGRAGRWRWRWTTHHSALQNQRQRPNSLVFIPPPDKKHYG